MEGMYDRDSLDEGTAGKGWPIKSMDVNEVKFGTPSLQLQKKFEKEIGLAEEALVGSGTAPQCGEAGRLYTIRYRNRLDGDAWYG